MFNMHMGIVVSCTQTFGYLAHLFLCTVSFNSVLLLLFFRSYLFSSGIPIVIVGVTAAVNLDNYGSRDYAP